MSYAQQCKLCSGKYATSSSSKGKKKNSNDEKIIPRILSCGHAFCDGCISSKLMTSEKDESAYSVTCPFNSCQIKSTLANGDVNSLPVHKYLLGSLTVDSTIRCQSASRLLKLLEKGPSDLLSPTTNVEKCFNCQQATADVLCVRCDNTRMCQPCFVEVHRSRVLASHQSTRLRDDNSQSRIKTLMDSDCSMHPGRNREYFCMDCAVAMCADCAILGSHSQHSFNKLDVVNREVIPKLVETRKLATKAVDLAHQSKRQLNIEKQGGSEEAMLANPTLEKIEEVFLKLHALLQLKQQAVEDSVYSATGDNSNLLRDFLEQVMVNGEKLEHLVSEIDEILSNPAYEKCCDFQLVNSTAEQMLKLPCHLVVNDISECADVKVDINEELLESFSSLVSVSVDSSSQTRYELKAIGDVPESVLESCPAVQSCSVAPSVRQPSEASIYSVNAIQVVHHGQNNAATEVYSSTSYSRQQSHNSAGSVETSRTPTADFPVQNSRSASRQSSVQLYEEDYSVVPGVPPVFGDTTSQYSFSSDRSDNSQAMLSPEYPSYGYGDMNYPQKAMNKGAFNVAPFVHDYGHMPQANMHNNYPQERVDHISGGFENAAHQYNHKQRNLNTPQQFAARDFRLADPQYNMTSDFSVYRAGAHPMSPPHLNMAQSKPKKKNPIGRGRGAPVLDYPQTPPSGPLHGPPFDAPTVPSYHSNLHTKKKLFMHPPAAIKERSLLVQVSHVESAECFYVQHPQRVKYLKRIQQKIVDHCNANRPLTDLHDVKFLFAKVNGLWKRGEVLKVLDRSVKVFCCDYGNTEKVKVSELRPAAGSLLSLPRQAIKCYLQGIQPADGGSSWTPECAEQMREILSHSTGVTLVKLDSPIIETDSVPVDLLMGDQCAASQLSMRDYLVFTEQAVWDSPCCPYVPDEKVLHQSYLKPQPIRAGDHLRLYITHVVSPDEVYAQVVNRYIDDNEPAKPEDTSAEIVKLESVMKEMGEKYSVPTSHVLYKVFIPKPGGAVAALYEKEWFRAQIIALLPGHVKVKYVDFGNVEIISADQIRVLFQEFKELPAQAVKLSIHGVSPTSEKGSWSKQLCDGLAQMCTESMCSAKIVYEGEGLQAIFTMTDTKENVANVLVQNGLAKRNTEEVTENEGIDCKFTHVESPGEFYVLPLHLMDKFTELTAKLDEAMRAGTVDGIDRQWQVNDNCVLQYSGSWVRAVIEQVIADSGRCKLRLIDTGQVINRPQSNLRVTPKIATYTAMATRACISGIIPAGGQVWGPTAKDTIKELVDGCESCKVVPVGEASNELPCDVLLPEELPGKLPGLAGEIIYNSLKEKLLETGVALRGEKKRAELIADPKKSQEQTLAHNLQSGDYQNTKKNILVEKLLRENAEEYDRSMQSQEVSSEKDCSPTNQHANSSSQQSQDDDLKLCRIDDLTAEPIVQHALAASLTAGDSLQRVKLKSTSPITDSLSTAKVQTSDGSRNVNFKVKSSGSKLLKSPGGTIRSQITEESSDHSLPFGDPTDKLLLEAATRLAASADTTLNRFEPSFVDTLNTSSDSSPDIPTPELNLKLANLVAKLTP